MIERLTTKAIRREELNALEMTAAMEEILSGRAAPAASGAFLAALRMKGETVAELAAAARVVGRRTRRIDPGPGGLVSIDREEIDTDAETIRETTGAAGTRVFNVSTATAFVVAGAGLRVARHGSRGGSGECGSADVLERLGVNLDVPPTAAESCVRTLGIGFLYAPLFDAGPAAAEVARQLGFRSMINRLAPLINPAGAETQVLGVYDPRQVEPTARVLRELGTRNALVACGAQTLDEISTCGRTRIARLAGGDVSTFELRPEDCGLERVGVEALCGGDARQNAGIVQEVLAGRKGPRRDIVCLNAAAVFTAAGLDGDFRAGVGRAADAIDSGRAMCKLEALIEFSRTCAQSVRSAEALSGFGA